MGTYNKFVQAQEQLSERSRNVLKSFAFISDYDYSNATAEYVINIIIDSQPMSYNRVKSICWALALYARYLHDDNLIQIVDGIDKAALWKKSNTSENKRFISHADFEEIYHDLGVYEECNSFYYQTLLKAIYEGIYNDDMSVIKNLRRSDIHGNEITLREDDGNTYKLVVSDGLINDLKDMSEITTTERKQRYGVMEIPISGLHSDSCFKIEIRNGSPEDACYRFVYYRMLRKIFSEYFGYSVSPSQLFISGIMYRIKLKLEPHGMTLSEAFADNTRNKTVSKICSDELMRCNYFVHNFRSLVNGYLSVFDNS